MNTKRTPTITSVDDLAGQLVGIQVGNTSDIVAKELKAKGAIADIKYYPYSGILDALDDLTAGTIGAFIKLLPVTTWLVEGPSRSRGGAGDPDPRAAGDRVRARQRGALRRASNGASRVRRHDGTVDRLRKHWLE